jgi:hypothetical protein
MAKERNLSVDYLERRIIEKLIAKYEKSSHYLNSGASSRRIMLRLGADSKDFNYYNIEDYEQKMAVHQAIISLTEKSLIDYEWERFNQGNVLKNIWLNLENIDAAYKLIGQVPKQEIVTRLSEDLTSMLIEFEARYAASDGEKSDIAPELAEMRAWLIPALHEQLDTMQKNAKIPALLGSAADIARDLLSIFRLLLEDDFKPMQMRVFSLKCFNDSKYFEQKMKSRITTFIRRYHPQLTTLDENQTFADDEVLELIGIRKNPEILEFRGPVKLHMNGSVIDFAPMTAGACFKTDNFEMLQKIEIENVQKIIFIENRTSYEIQISKGRDKNEGHDKIDERDKNELIVYHGGFHSLKKRRFLQMLTEAANQQVEIYHWGDIDLGGFKIFLQIKNNISNRVKPWQMDSETLLKYKNMAGSYDENYRHKLEKALEDQSYAYFHDVIKTMLKYNIRLEQEAISIK